jgi:hypothetical protein
MLGWQGDNDLACIRRAEAIAKLPEPERQTWLKLWGDVADTLERAQANAPPDKK